MDILTEVSQLVGIDIEKHTCICGANCNCCWWPRGGMAERLMYCCCGNVDNCGCTNCCGCGCDVDWTCPEIYRMASAKLSAWYWRYRFSGISDCMLTSQSAHAALSGLWDASFIACTYKQNMIIVFKLGKYKGHSIYNATNEIFLNMNVQDQLILDA